MPTTASSKVSLHRSTCPFVEPRRPARCPPSPGDLTRYAGAWYEIALLPNRFQKQCVADTQARYRLDGERVEVDQPLPPERWQRGCREGHAKVVEGSNNAKLRVSFFWPFYGDYWVLALDADYRQVLVGAPSRKVRLGAVAHAADGRGGAAGAAGAGGAARV